MPRGWFKLVLVGILVGTGSVGCADTATSSVGKTEDVPTFTSTPCGAYVNPGTPAPSASPAASPQSLPTSFVPVSVRWCVARTVEVAGDGEWLENQTQVATEGLDALVTALRLPSATPAKGTVCPGVGWIPVILTLTDAGGVSIVPVIHHAVCGGDLPQVTTALNGLPWRTVKAERLQRVRSRAEIDSGCSGSYKPVLDLEGSGATSVGGTVDFFRDGVPTTVEVCRYKLDPGDTMTENGRSFQVGQLDTAAVLTGEPLRTLVNAIQHAPAVVGTCDKPPAAFALVSPKPQSGNEIEVELGGCYRVSDGSGHFRRLDAATVKLLTG